MCECDPKGADRKSYLLCEKQLHGLWTVREQCLEKHPEFQYTMSQATNTYVNGSTEEYFMRHTPVPHI